MKEINALNIRTHFSIGESLLTPKEIVSLAKQANYKSVAIVDTMSVSSMVEFSKKAKEEGIKPIIGCRLRIMQDWGSGKPEKGVKYKTWYPKVYVKNDDGMNDLLALLSIANDENHFYYVPNLKLEELLKALKKGNLIFSTGDFYSVFHCDDKKTYHYDTILKSISDACRESDAFVELVPIESALFDTLNAKAIGIAKQFELPTLVTYPFLYAENEDADSLDIMTAIAGRKKISQTWRPQQTVKDFGFKSQFDIARKVVAAQDRVSTEFGSEFTANYWLSGLENTAKLAAKVEYVWSKREISLPTMAADEYKTLVDECKKGWAKRLTNPTMGYMPDKSQLPLYVERLKYELGVLKNMGFERYFLLVQDLVKSSKEMGIIVGPGRGSVGGSLVAYLMEITDVDPIRFDLLFERFINPDRLDLPDADLDFMSTRRHEVVQYLIEKYGENKVAGISNYTTMASASALRDCGRFYEISQTELAVSKYVLKEHGKPKSIEESAVEVPELAAFKEKYPEPWRHAVKLAGRMRSMGQHAAGIVVADEPIIKRAIVEKRSGNQVINWDKRTVEDWGLVKIDILGLSMLDVFYETIENIKTRWKRTVNLTEIPLDDPAIFDMFAKTKTVGVFQFESSGMRKLLKDLAMGGNLTFEDLVATVALYRPGPLDAGLVDEYIQIKQGTKEPFYEHENMKEALKATSGVIVYQEQVMQLARDLAGFTMTEADWLRKAMGKKDAEMMGKQRDKWVNGCIDHSGMKKSIAEEIFNKIEVFAGYAFNRSHSVEYVIISYWSMWFKTYYPADFYAALLSIESNEDRLGLIVRDAKAQGFPVLPPDINKSGYKFQIDYDAKREETVLLAPFKSLKGLSDNTAKVIIEARDKVGKFKDKEHFLDTVDKRRCNKRHQDVLDRVGVFASLEPWSYSSRHPDRLKDQMELMPGLIIQNVKSDKILAKDKATKHALIKEVLSKCSDCEDCDLAGGVHPLPRMGSAARFMVVTDCPTHFEEQELKMHVSPGADYVKEALSKAGLNSRQGYFTSLVKSPKSDKKLTSEQINACSKYLRKEIEILGPPIIIALGTTTIRHLAPGAKGNYEELAGRIVYDPDLDANIVFGINPQIIYHHPSHQETLNDVFRKVAELLDD